MGIEWSRLPPPAWLPRSRISRLTIIFTAAFFVLVSVIATYDYYDSHHRTHERATVVSETETPYFCGKSPGNPQYRVTWHSTNPPHGLPATFVQGDDCAFYNVGDSRTIIRRRQIDGSTLIEVSPFDSVTDELILVAAGTLLSVPVAFILAIWRVGKRPLPVSDERASSNS